jgi:hypothetical protein
MKRNWCLGYDDTMSWSWTAALVVLLPMMRVEIDYADRNPSYRALRHWLRLVLFASGTFYLEAIDQHAPAFVAAVASAHVAISCCAPTTRKQCGTPASRIYGCARLDH